MKTVKLIIIFILILGGVIGAFFLFNNGEGSALPPPAAATYQNYRTQFEKEWEQKGDWDEQLFLSHCDMIQQLSTKYETATLRDLNTKTATEIVYKKIFDEWKSPSCRKNVVDKYNKAIGIIESKDGNAKFDPNVKKIKEVSAIYASAYELARQSIGLLPRFNGSTWNSYSQYSSDITIKRNNILGNDNYKTYLSNITEIKKGLNNIPKLLSDGKASFYSTLSKQIIDYYNESARTMDNQKRLRNVISNFGNEYPIPSALNNFSGKFATDVSHQ